MTAEPFVKWTGGKRQLLWRIMEVMPKTSAVFWEPFLGGGAVFFAMAAAKRFRRAVLSDVNEELVRTWLAIQRNVVGVLRELDKHKHEERHYYRVRAQNPKKLSDEKTAARMLFMNSACFNGLVRYNASGAFNVPFGRQPKMLQFKDPAMLKACARVLNDMPVTIIAGDFEDVTRKVRLGDSLLVDPPYAPISKTSNFVGFTPAGFAEADQVRLAEWFKRLDARGVSALLSNSSCDLTDRLYKDFAIERIGAKRAINSDASKRGEVKEILVKTSALVQQNAIG